jgi:hypothetical protein
VLFGKPYGGLNLSQVVLNGKKFVVYKITLTHAVSLFNGEILLSIK